MQNFGLKIRSLLCLPNYGHHHFVSPNEGVQEMEYLIGLFFSNLVLTITKLKKESRALKWYQTITIDIFSPLVKFDWK